MRVTQRLLDRFRAYHNKHCTWGSLHIALDDGNLQNEDIKFCLQYAREQGDVEGAVLAQLLLSCTVNQRDMISRKT